MDTRKPADLRSPVKASHDTGTPDALVEFMSTGWLDKPMSVSAEPHRDGHREHRRRLSQAYPGEYLVIPAGEEQVRANDTNYRFRPSSDFAYLVGPGEPGALLVMEPLDGGGHDSLLFVPAHNRGKAEFFTDRVYGELWVGRHRGVDESQLYYGVDRCRPGQAPPAEGIENLYLSGDYTRTGWPATMEGAVRSGYQAAEAVLARSGRPDRVVQPD